MEKEITFSYSYSAKENKEVQEIRSKYLPREESKFDELKRLDNAVKTSGITASLCVGVLGTLVFGFGMCLSMHIIGGGTPLAALGVFVGIAGMAGMLLAYPLYRRISHKTKAKLAPRILELADELSVSGVRETR